MCGGRPSAARSGHSGLPWLGTVFRAIGATRGRFCAKLAVRVQLWVRRSARVAPQISAFFFFVIAIYVAAAMYCGGVDLTRCRAAPERK